MKVHGEPPLRKLLYRRGGISHTLSHRLSHTLSHVTYPSSVLPAAPLVLPPRAGHRRQFDEADRRHILVEAAEPGASVSEVARRYGIARRVLCRWRQEQAARNAVLPAQWGDASQRCCVTVLTKAATAGRSAGRA